MDENNIEFPTNCIWELLKVLSFLIDKIGGRGHDAIRFYLQTKIKDGFVCLGGVVPPPPRG